MHGLSHRHLHSPAAIPVHRVAAGLPVPQRTCRNDHVLPNARPLRRVLCAQLPTVAGDDRSTSTSRQNGAAHSDSRVEDKISSNVRGPLDPSAGSTRGRCQNSAPCIRRHAGMYVQAPIHCRLPGLGHPHAHTPDECMCMWCISCMCVVHAGLGSRVHSTAAAAARPARVPPP